MFFLQLLPIRIKKQHLALRDYQYRTASKQATHIFTIFVIFAFLEIQKINQCAKNSAHILHKMCWGKSAKLLDQFETFWGLLLFLEKNIS